MAGSMLGELCTLSVEQSAVWEYMHYHTHLRDEKSDT